MKVLESSHKGLFWLAGSFLILGLLMVTCTACAPRRPSVSSVSSPFPANIGSNALSQCERFLALGPRDSFTPGAEKAANWLADQLRVNGIEPDVRLFHELPRDGRMRPVRNVLGRLPGKTDCHVLLLSHYDTKSGIADDFVGANDSGSSTGLLLALAAFYKTVQPPCSITFAFLDGEECVSHYGEDDGLHGSRHLAKTLGKSGERVDAVILLDMIGDKNLSLTIPRNGSSRLQKILLDSASALGVREHVRLVPYDMLDDHVPFMDAGFEAIDLIDFEFGAIPGLNNYWHTPEDTFDKLSAESLQTVGAIVHEMLRRIAVEDASSTAN